MTRQYVPAAAAGLLSAVLYGIPLLNVVTQLPLFVSGLGIGPAAAAVAGIAGSALIFFGAGALFAVNYLGAIAVPVVALTALALYGARRDDGWLTGIALAALAVLGTAAFLLFATWNAGGEGVEAAVRRTVANGLELIGGDMPDATRERIVDTQAAYFPAMVLVALSVLAVVNGVLGQAVATQLGWAQRPTPRYNTLRVPTAYEWAPVVAMAIALAAGSDLGYTARNAALVLLVPYFFQGLAVVHVWARRLPSPGAILGVFYITVLLLSVFGLAAVTVLGFIETWAGLRQQATGPGGSQGEA